MTALIPLIPLMPLVPLVPLAPLVPLDWQCLRTLSVDPHHHPRGQPHLSAASGLVCAFGRVYVVADDENHLAVFTDLEREGTLHRLLPGDLPPDAAERKRRKADLETLALLPAGVAAQGAALLMLGSGSTPQRDGAVLQALDASGELVAAARRFALTPLYRPLRARLGEINIEGLVCAGASLWLFNRGGSGGRGANALVRVDLRAVLALADDDAAASDIAPAALHLCELGDTGGVGYGFTDAAALPREFGGGFLFTAVAEDSAGSVADGACVGSALGSISAQGELRWMRPLRGAPKVEGIDVHAAADGLTLCLVTDADDPGQASVLLRARP